MFKRLLPLLLGLAILAAVPLGANAAGSVSINLNFNSASPAAPKSDLYLNLVFASAGQYFGFTAFQSCAGYYQRPSELVAALYISSETGRPPRTILQAKHGKGWGRLAKEMGVHPGYWAKGKGPKKHRYVEYWDDEEFETRLYLRYLGEYYGAESGAALVLAPPRLVPGRPDPRAQPGRQSPQTGGGDLGPAYTGVILDSHRRKVSPEPVRPEPGRSPQPALAVTRRLGRLDTSSSSFDQGIKSMMHSTDIDWIRIS